MKNIIVKTATLCLALFSTSAFAEKIIITGQPIVIEKQGDFYVVPENYKATKDYHYFTIEGKDRVCFLDKRPDFASLEVISINVQIGPQKATWNCYPTDPTYFAIQR